MEFPNHKWRPHWGCWDVEIWGFCRGWSFGFNLLRGTSAWVLFAVSVVNSTCHRGLNLSRALGCLAQILGVCWLKETRGNAEFIEDPKS